MRIVGVRVATVGRILAITYAVFGLANFLVYAFGQAGKLTLPIGVMMPLFNLNLNLHMLRSTDLVYNAILAVASVLSFALTGWITGVAVTLCFNFIAQKTGGIDATFVSVTAGETEVETTI